MTMNAQEKIAAAKELAESNYSTWGQWVVECMTDTEIARDLQGLTLSEWVDYRQQVANRFSEIENTAW